MKYFYQVIAIGILFSIIFVQGLERRLFAADVRHDVLSVKSKAQAPGFTVAELSQCVLENLRLLRHKQEQQMFHESKRSTRSGQSRAIASWIKAQQQESPLRLVTSFPEDSSIQDQAFTYDQALAGIVLVKQGDKAAAKQLFNFFNSQWDGHGFYTTYNTQDADGPRIETSRTVGPNAWIGLFALHYYKATGDAKALTLATAIGKWVAEKVPHRNGGIAMGEDDIWSGIFSTENNLSYYALADALSGLAKSKADRALFTLEKEGVQNWVKSENYDAATGLFKRGPSDATNSFDVNSWALLTFGPAKLQTSFGIDAAAFVQNIEKNFSVQPDGSFGGDILTAKGFDFSDAANAQSASRAGMNWVEGSNHMVVVYKELYQYWRSKDKTVAQQYLNKALYFAGLNSQVASTQNGQTSYLYTDAPGGTLIFHDILSWRTPSGEGVASTAWAYFGFNGINPFDL